MGLGARASVLARGCLLKEVPGALVAIMLQQERPLGLQSTVIDVRDAHISCAVMYPLIRLVLQAVQLCQANSLGRVVDRVVQVGGLKPLRIPSATPTVPALNLCTQPLEEQCQDKGEIRLVWACGGALLPWSSTRRSEGQVGDVVGSAAKKNW